MSPARSEAVQAAGALVWRLRRGRLQVALVHRPRYRDWSWPKGKLEPGEHPVTAAVREVEEETGLPVVLGRPLPGLRYRLSDGRPKRVHYWAAQIAGRSATAALHAREPVTLAGSDEIDRIRWMDVEQAHRKLTRRADTRPLEALVTAHHDGSLDTRALVVVRHGRARRRAAWESGEDTRPLTPTGRTQAEAIVPLLSAFGVAEVITSPWARCRSTVQPYLDAADLEPRTKKPLTELGHQRDAEAAADLITRLLSGDRDRALCTHRPVLPTIMRVLTDHTTPGAHDQLPQRDPWLKTGQILVAHIRRDRTDEVSKASDRTVMAVERHRPRPS